MTAKSLTASLLALLAGIVFASGLVLGGMTDPRKVQGFLDVGGIAAGRWDASLAFVMAGALIVSLIAFSRTVSRTAQDVSFAPWVADRFDLPTRKDIDTPLVVGAVMFGVGWGLAGYCPGPAIASLLVGGTDILWFVAAMLAGMLAARRWFSR